MQKLVKLNENEKIDYFKYSNISKKEPNFCPLFAKNKVCHNMENLNCYLCGCPNFRFNDDGFEEINGKKLFSYCAINSKDGKRLTTANGYHQDCSNCLIPHNKAFIKDNFDEDWSKIMQKNMQ